MTLQDLIATLIAALCAVLFLKRLFLPRRRKKVSCCRPANQPSLSATHPTEQNTRPIRQSAATHQEKNNPDSPSAKIPPACAGCPFYKDDGTCTG